ncbi:hypothetical protein PR048_013378 [Dryococelus australis]|uniref:Uncharacterized protein n=1 Tax=Dryococelus australis TaxID=614101 RepID=A0ABQ9HRZ8_9NEOP|nr:hypothetical protein PR048_013378 [Dryococelus australis]
MLGFYIEELRLLKATADFCMEIAHCICCSVSNSVRNGRPSNDLEVQIQAKKSRGPTAHMPPRDVRQNQVGHFPSHLDVRQRCKMPGCKGFSWVQCDKCAVALYFHKGKNCYKMFHLQ